MTDQVRTTAPVTAEDVTDEMIEMALNVVEGWYSEGRIDWPDVWDRMDDSELEDGSRLDMGTDLGSPALEKIKREVRKSKRV